MYLRRKNLTRKERLCKKNDLKRLFNNAKKIRYKSVTLLYIKNEFEYNRIAVIARKGFQNAVIRNRQKRLVREAYRDLKSKLKAGYDFIIFVFPLKLNSSNQWSNSQTYSNYCKILSSLFYKCKLM